MARWREASWFAASALLLACGGSSDTSGPPGGKGGTGGSGGVGIGGAAGWPGSGGTGGGSGGYGGTTGGSGGATGGSGGATGGSGGATGGSGGTGGATGGSGGTGGATGGSGGTGGATGGSGGTGGATGGSGGTGGATGGSGGTGGATSCAASATCNASTGCSVTCTLDGATKWCRSFDNGAYAWVTQAYCGNNQYPTGTTFKCGADSSWPSGAGVCCGKGTWETTCTCANSSTCDANTGCSVTCTLDGATKWCRSFNGGAYSWVTQAYCGTSQYPTGTTFSCGGDSSWPSGAGICCSTGTWATSC